LATKPRSSREEVARRGDEIYEQEILPHLQLEDEGKFALIDIGTGDYEVDHDEIAASDRLLARHPEAQVWTRQVGSRYARRRLRRIAVDGADTDPLLGTGLLYGHELNVQFIEGGSAAIRALSLF
jgi:hypothetical protein